MHLTEVAQRLQRLEADVLTPERIERAITTALDGYAVETATGVNFEPLIAKPARRSRRRRRRAWRSETASSRSMSWCPRRSSRTPSTRGRLYASPRRRHGRMLRHILNGEIRLRPTALDDGRRAVQFTARQSLESLFDVTPFPPRLPLFNVGPGGLAVNMQFPEALRRRARRVFRGREQDLAARRGRRHSTGDEITHSGAPGGVRAR
jgi:hypothetical protein